MRQLAKGVKREKREEDHIRSTSRLTRLETETVISFNLAEDFAVVATRMDRVKTILRKRGIEPYRKQADYECYKVPKRWIKISPPRKVSEERRAELAERARKSGIGKSKK